MANCKWTALKVLFYLNGQSAWQLASHSSTHSHTDDDKAVLNGPLSNLWLDVLLKDSVTCGQEESEIEPPKSCYIKSC